MALSQRKGTRKVTRNWRHTFFFTLSRLTVRLEVRSQCQKNGPRSWGRRILVRFLLSFQNKTREEGEKGTYQDGARCRARRRMVSVKRSAAAGLNLRQLFTVSQATPRAMGGVWVRTRWETRREVKKQKNNKKKSLRKYVPARDKEAPQTFFFIPTGRFCP